MRGISNMEMCVEIIVCLVHEAHTMDSLIDITGFHHNTLRKLLRLLESRGVAECRNVKRVVGETGRLRYEWAWVGKQ